MQVHDGRGLGRWYAPDPRNRDYSFAGTIRRKSVLHNADGPILDQDGVGACGGFMDTDVLNTGMFAKSRKRGSKSSRYMGNDSGFGFYHYATMLDEWFDETWEPDDTGTSVVACAKAMQKANYIDRYEWAFDLSGALAALERQPIMLGTLWTSGMDDPDRRGLVRPTGDLVGGHAFMGFGVNYPSDRVRCRNHWTDEWGVDGDFYIGIEDLGWLIEQNGEVVVPIPV